MMLRLIATILLLAGCSHGRHAATTGAPSDKSQELQAKRKAKVEASGFTAELYQAPQDCDWTLWAGKLAMTDVKINMDVVEYAPGEIHRRPKDQGECYPAHSDSTVSDDQLTGYAGARFRSGDLSALQRLSSYASSHNLVMGEPSSAVGDVVLKEGLLVLIDRMIAKLSGHGEPPDPAPEYEPVSADYAQHIQAMQIVLHGEAHGSITDQMLTRLNGLAAGSPTDETFAAALAVYTGDYNHAMDLLLDDSTPLPTYVRGERPDVYAEIYWLWAADLVLRHTHGNNTTGTVDVYGVFKP